MKAIFKFSPNKHKLSMSFLLAGLLAISCQPIASAYYWGYGGNWGTSLLGSLGFLAYPLVNRGPYSANPVFSTHSFIRRGAQRALTAPLFYRPYYLNNYKDEEPLYDPRSRYRPVRLQNIGQDQVTKANWKKPIVNNTQQPPLGYTATQQQVPSVLSDDYDPFAIRYPEQIPVQNPSNNMPPLAPSYTIPNSVGSANSVSSNSNVISKSEAISPIADGFVSTIVTEFDGNIALALMDPATRSWAKALGLIDNTKYKKDSFPQTRIHLIRQILLDSSLSSVSKLDAIKILLPRGGANRANKSGL